MTILGIHIDTHDTGAAVLRNGQIAAAVNEERLSRKKMDGGAPYRSIEAVMAIAGCSEKDIDIVSFSGFRPGLKKLFYFFWQQHQRVWFTRFGYLGSFLNPKTFDLGRFLRQTGLAGIKEFFRVSWHTYAIIRRFRARGFKGRVEFVNHNLCHAAGAYFTSGFPSGLVAIIEGSSFTNTASFWWAERNSLKKIYEIPLPHSIGRYYETVAALLKIDGLKVTVHPKLYSLYDEYFARGKRLPPYFGNSARENVAAAFQKRLEDVVLELLRNLLKRYPSDSLMLSGGVAANVKLNLELTRLDGIEKVFVHPGMSNVGQALGAALATARRHEPDFGSAELKAVYWGNVFSDQAIEAYLKNNNIGFSAPENLAGRVGQLLSQNKVVGLYQGRMEYGPRALGNRSILYPATDPAVNDWLNKQLKRTEFMPFAPVTLAERADDCYEKPDIDKGRLAARFMTIAVRTTDYMKQKMPAAVHVDGTARPQLISRDINPFYYDIIKSYENITGLPSLVNTSFNMHEEAIVCSPDDAVKAYEQSKLDALVLGKCLIIRGQ